MVDKTSVPYLFSPNFTYMIDFNYRAKQFIIRECETQNVYLRIPKDLLNTVWNGREGEGAIKIICSRMTWLSERVLRIVNEENLDCLFEMTSTDPKDETIEARHLKLLSIVKIDNLLENTIMRDSPHLIMHRTPMQPRDVLDRLIRMNQEYKRSLITAMTLHDNKYKLLEKISNIDYMQKWGSSHSSFDIQLSFTWLDWRILEQLIHDDSFDLGNVETEQKIQLCFNILPQGRGVLHMLALGGQTAKADHTKIKGDQI